MEEHSSCKRDVASSILASSSKCTREGCLEQMSEWLVEPYGGRTMKLCEAHEREFIAGALRMLSETAA